MKVAKRKKSMLDREIDHAYERLKNLDPADEEYAKIVTNLQKLNEMKQSKKAYGVSNETWVKIGANLLGIGMILHAEETKIVTSKAINFVLKGRV